MSPTDRRQFMGTISLAGLGGFAAPSEAAAAPRAEAAAAAVAQEGGTQPATGVTRALARYVVGARYTDIPAPVRKEAQRTLLNWMGCAVGGSRVVRVKLRVVAEQGRAIFADDLGIVAHVAENVRMIEWRPRADAHEFLRPDVDHGHPRLVVEMRDDVIGHGYCW